MFSRFIRDNVCTRCIDANINKVANFRVRSSKLKFSCGHNEARYVITGAGSHVKAYFGFEGFNTDTPLKKRLTRSSEPRLTSVINDNAERYYV